MKKYVAVVSAFILFMSGFSGCSSLENKGVTTVVFQTWNPSDSGPDSPIYKIIDDFEKKNPDINIEYKYYGSDSYQEHLRVDLIGENGPDVFGISSGAAFNTCRDFEEELGAFCNNAWGQNWQDKFYDSCIEQVSDRYGKIYGLPLGQTYAGYLWADVKMLEQYGCTVPTNYKEMQSTCKILRENNQWPLAIGAADSWVNLDIWMSIAADVDRIALYDAINGNISFDSEPIIESFRIWQNCFKDGVFQDNATEMTLYDDVNDMFQREGLIPMFANGSWAMNMYTVGDKKTRDVFDASGANHEVFLIDWNNDGRVSPVTASTDVILCMNPESRVKEAAFKWMDYLVNEGQDVLVNQYLEYMPSRTDLVLNVQDLRADGKKNLDYILENGENNVAGLRIIQNEDLNLAIGEILEELALMKITPKDAAYKMQQVSKTL